MRSRLAGLVNQRGISLTEVLIACSLSVLVVSASYGLLDFGQTSWESASQGAEAQRNAGLAVDSITRVLREAKGAADESETVPLAESGQITFHANVDADAYPERIRYFLINRTLMRGVVEYQETGGYTGSETQEKIAEHVSVFSLQYFDSQSNPVTAPLGKEQRAQVRMVTVVLVTDVDPTRPPLPVRMESVARMRNLSYAD